MNVSKSFKVNKYKYNLFQSINHSSQSNQSISVVEFTASNSKQINYMTTKLFIYTIMNNSVSKNDIWNGDLMHDVGNTLTVDTSS